MSLCTGEAFRPRGRSSLSSPCLLSLCVSVGRAHHHRKRMHSILRFRTKVTFRRSTLQCFLFADHSDVDDKNQGNKQTQNPPSPFWRMLKTLSVYLCTFTQKLQRLPQILRQRCSTLQSAVRIARIFISTYHTYEYNFTGHCFVSLAHTYRVPGTW